MEKKQPLLVLVEELKPMVSISQASTEQKLSVCCFFFVVVFFAWDGGGEYEQQQHHPAAGGVDGTGEMGYVQEDDDSQEDQSESEDSEEAEDGPHVPLSGWVWDEAS